MRNIIIIVLTFVLFKPQSLLQTTPQAAALQTDIENITAQYQPIVVSIVATKDIPVIKRCLMGKKILTYLMNDPYRDFINIL